MTPCRRDRSLVLQSAAGLLAAVIVGLGLPQALAESPTLIRYQEPEFLTFEELRELSRNPYPTRPVHDKYERLLRVPIISNEATLSGVQPHKPSRPELGGYVRVMTWNIEHSLGMDAAIDAFTNPEAFAQRIDPEQARRGSRRHKRAMAERTLLEGADIILLQEMDLGVKRSGYRDAARDLALALQMNYAYLPEYLEIDPVLLGIDTVRFEEGQEDVEATKHFAVDPARYKGMFGTAVLSRYPIVHVEGFPLFNQGYDWYWQERLKPTFLEKVRRFGARTVFKETVHREMKVGGRTYFRVDLAVPQLPEGRVSVINVHLEIKAQPQARAEQISEILHYIKEIPHPVILAGDFNSAPSDLSPTSTPRVLARGLSSPEFWLSRVIEYLLPQAIIVNVLRYVANATKNYQDPTAVHVPVVAPNDVGELFSIIQRFRFADGRSFDFRGTRRARAGGRGKLGNSNERDAWAYRVTFRTDRTLAHLIGKFRLDWIFVKGYGTVPFDRNGPYRFAPHFGRTLNGVNKYLQHRISDHDPCLVDLPLQEPPPSR